MSWSLCFKMQFHGPIGKIFVEVLDVTWRLVSLELPASAADCVQAIAAVFEELPRSGGAVLRYQEIEIELMA